MSPTAPLPDLLVDDVHAEHAESVQLLDGARPAEPVEVALGHSGEVEGEGRGGWVEVALGHPWEGGVEREYSPREHLDQWICSVLSLLK